MSSTPQERERQAARVFLANHGDTEWDGDRFLGSSDISLSAGGREQAEQIARRLAGEPLAAIYSSPLQRAAETADSIARAHGLAVAIVDSLREMDFGDWEGRTRSAVMAEYTVVYGAWTRDPATVRPPRGESGYDVEARAVAAIKELARNHQGETIAVIGHATVNRILLCQLLGINLVGYRERLAQETAAINCVEIDARGRGHLYLLNDTSFLSPAAPIAAPHDEPEPARAASEHGQEPAGAHAWLVPYALFRLESKDDGHSQPVLAILNPGKVEAQVVVDVLFEDRPAVSGEPVVVAGERLLRLGLDQIRNPELERIVPDVVCALRIRADNPVIVQYLPGIGATAIAYPGGRQSEQHT